MIHAHTTAALPRISLSRNIHTIPAVHAPGTAKLSAVPGFKPEASGLTADEIRNIVQDILG